MRVPESLSANLSLSLQTPTTRADASHSPNERCARDTLLNTSLLTAIGTDPEPELVVDQEGLIVFANSPAEHLFHAERGGLIGRAFAHTLRPGEAREITLYLPDKRKSAAELRAIALQTSCCPLQRIRIRPTHERLHQLEALEKSHATLHALMEAAPLGLIAVDLAGRVMLWNRAARHMLGWRELELRGLPLPQTSDDPAHSLHGVFEQALHGHLCEALELPAQRRADGQTIDLQVWTAQLDAPHGTPGGILILVADITTTRRIRGHILRLVGHDPLTGLPNQRQFRKQLHRTLSKRSKRDQLPLIVLQLGIDGLRKLSRLLGHAGKEALLQKTARRLAGALYETDLIAYASDETFSIMLRHTRHLSEGARVADKLRQQFFQPIEIQGETLHVRLSIGIAVFPNDGKNAEGLIRAADIALERARENGGDQSLYYTSDLDISVREELSLERSLRQADLNGEFYLAYQPQFDLAKGCIVGVEALLRWKHPVLGQISPAQFIPVAESSGQIVDLGAWVLQQACQQLVAWEQAGLPPLRMAVNLSTRQLHHETLLATLDRTLQSTGLAPERLELEITESVLIRNTPQTIALLRNIRERGVRLAIDDFGTGFSSLAYLARLPIDTLKIDRSFINRIGEHRANRVIVQAILALANGLSLRTVAEGVETAEEMDAMRWLGCDEVQGYWISRPLRSEALFERLQQETPAPHTVRKPDIP